MARTIASGMQTAIASERSEIAHLIQLEFSGGTTYLTTATGDIAWGGDTYTAVGGSLAWGEVVEMADRRSEGVKLVLSGVDGSIVSTLLSNNFRGRNARVYIAHLDPDDGSLVADPLLVFQGHQSGSYNVREQRDPKMEKPGTVTVETRVVSRMGALDRVNETRTNPTSHRALLKRGGFTGTDLDDAFFLRTASIVGATVMWGGQLAGVTPHGYRNTGGGTDTGRTGKPR